MNKQKLLAKIMLKKNMPKLKRAHKLWGNPVILNRHKEPDTDKEEAIFR